VSHATECFAAALVQIAAQTPDRITTDLLGQHSECACCAAPLVNQTCHFACNGEDDPAPLCVECADGAILSGYAVLN